MDIFDYLPDFCREKYICYEPSLNGQLHIGYSWIFLVFLIIGVLIFEEYNSDYDKYIEPDKIINNLIKKVRRNHIQDINWKRALIVGFILSGILCIFIFYPFEIPPGFVYFFLTLIIFGAYYLSTAWESSHWWKMINYKIEDKLLEFKYNILNK